MIIDLIRFTPASEPALGALATLIAGRTVDVRCAGLAGLWGKTERSGDRAIIHLSPDTPEGEQVDTFLHEVAHVKLHWQTLPDRAATRRPGGRRFTPGEAMLRKALVKVQEDEADAAAGRWRKRLEASDGHPAAAIFGVLTWPD